MKYVCLEIKWIKLWVPGAGGGVGEEGHVGGELAPEPGKWTHTNKTLLSDKFIQKYDYTLELAYVVFVCPLFRVGGLCSVKPYSNGISFTWGGEL